MAALDVSDGRARGGGWLDEGEPVTSVARRLEDQGVVRALVTGIATDGMMTGPDLDVVEAVANAAPGMRLIGSGGVGSLDDLRALVIVRENGGTAPLLPHLHLADELGQVVALGGTVQALVDA